MWLTAATVLTAALLPLGAMAMLARPIVALVALELAGTTATLVLLCLAEGFRSPSYFGIAVLAAVLTWVNGLIVARFLGRPA